MKILKKTVTALVILIVAAWLVTYLALRFETHEYTKMSEEQLAAADAYLQGKLTPAPVGWQFSWFTPEPNVDLRTGMVDAENAKGTVIVVPGFTDSMDMVMREIVRINEAGYRVASIEYRGQGESYRPLRNPEKGYVESYEKLGAELAEFAEQVRIEGKPLFFFSISKGGHITMRMAGEQQPDVAAYALIVPMIKVNTGAAKYNSMRTVATVIHKLGLGTMYAPGQKQWPNGELIFGKAIPCNANPDTAQTTEALFAKNERQRTNGGTVTWLYRTAASTDKITSASHMAAITPSVLIFTAGIDTLVDTEAAEKFCAGLANCAVRHFAESRHCIARENFVLYDGVIDEAIALFDQKVLDSQPPNQ